MDGPSAVGLVVSSDCSGGKASGAEDSGNDNRPSDMRAASQVESSDPRPNGPRERQDYRHSSAWTIRVWQPGMRDARATGLSQIQQRQYLTRISRLNVRRLCDGQRKPV